MRTRTDWHALRSPSREPCNHGRVVLSHPIACSIHTSGSKVLSRDHPDARAIFYENDTYSKRRINDLIAVLRAFESAAAVRDIFHKRRSSASAADADDADETADFVRSPLLRHIVHNAFPNLRPLLAFFSRAFDKDKVSTDGWCRALQAIAAAPAGDAHTVRRCAPTLSRAAGPEGAQDHACAGHRPAVRRSLR